MGTGIEDVATYTLFGTGMRMSDRTLYIYPFTTNGGYFEFFGERPHLGRFYDESDDQPGAEPVAVLSHLTWRRHFAADPEIIGKNLELEGSQYTIIGVTRPGFQGSGIWAHLYLPLASAPGRVIDRTSRELRNLTLVVRLERGTDAASMQERLSNLAAGLEQEFPSEVQARAPFLEAYRDSREPMDVYQRAARLLLIATFLLLLLATASVTNLMLVRTLECRKELATLAALGASRMRLVRRLLLESLMLAMLGGVFGLVLSYGVTQLIETFLRNGMPLGLGEFSMGTRLSRNERLVGLFTVALTLLVGLLAGTLPAILALRTNLVAAMKSDGATASGRASGRTRLPSMGSALVILQVALSAAILMGSVLLVRNLSALQERDLGFDPDGLTLATVYVPRAAPDSVSQTEEERVERGVALWNALRADTAALPGVSSASVSWRVPLGFIDDARLQLPGVEFLSPGPEPESEVGPEVRYSVVGRDWFETLGTPILRGRGFDGRDQLGSLRVAVVNEAAAQLLEELDPSRPGALGRTFGLESRFEVPEQSIEVVGVVANSRYTFPQDPIQPIVFLPFEQAYRPRMTLLVRLESDGLPGDVASAVRTLMHERYADLALMGIYPFEEQVKRAFSDHSMNAWIGTILAALALALAMFSVFSVLSYRVSLRRREFGIRMAVGATASEILRVVVRSAILLVFVGLGLGLVLAFALRRGLEGVVFGINSADPFTSVFVLLVLSLSGCVAALVPGIRAVRTSPAQVLRGD